MILSRRIPKPTGALIKKPSSSGPRWEIWAAIRRRTPASGAACRRAKTLPTMPHTPSAPAVQAHGLSHEVRRPAEALVRRPDHHLGQKADEDGEGTGQEEHHHEEYQRSRLEVLEDKDAIGHHREGEQPQHEADQAESPEHVSRTGREFPNELEGKKIHDNLLGAKEPVFRHPMSSGVVPHLHLDNPPPHPGH